MPNMVTAAGANVPVESGNFVMLWIIAGEITAGGQSVQYVGKQVV